MRIIRVWKAPKNEHGARYVTVDEHGVWKAPKNEHGARYVTVDEHGKLIYAYKKLADIRKVYKVELELHFVELKRELNHTWSADGK